MTDSPAILLAGGGPKTRLRGRVLAPARYRHPGDVIRLIAAALVLAVAVVIALLLPALLRPAAAVTGVGPATEAGQVLTGLVQVMIAAAALVLLAAALRYRRFRVLATVAGGFAAAAALMAAITYLARPGGPVPAGLRQGSWLAGAGFPDPAVLAGLAAVAVAAAPWLSRPWRRASWATLLLIGVARLVTGGLLPLQLVLALATGVTVGAGLLVAFGVPDRRMGPAGVAAALRAGGVPVSQVTRPLRAAKGSRPFQATTGDGNGLFVKVFGSDQRDADLLYRAWRGKRMVLDDRECRAEKGDSALGKGLDPALRAGRILAGSVRRIRRGCVMDVRVREVPAQVVVTEQRMVDQQSLERWLPEAMARVHKTAGSMAAGTAEQPYLLRDHVGDEPVFIVIYEGNPNEGETAVECCTPLHADGAAPDGAATRTIPAHREAYVRVLKRTVQSGAVGDVYVAIENWIEGQGLEIAAAPRETYWTGFYSAAADDEVFDVAFPVR